MPEPVNKTKTPAKPRKAPVKKGAASTSNVQTIDGSSIRPSHDQIAELARKYWAERGYADGHQEEDWLRAEQALRGKAS